jgi:serine/threonine-protein kinase HipA
MPHVLNLLANETKVATIEYDSMEDHWRLQYEQEWLSSTNAHPLSPALPLGAPTNGYAPGALKRFVENLLPEGRVHERPLCQALNSCRLKGKDCTRTFGLLI